MSATIGVRAAIAPNSSMSSAMPNSWASARRWSTPFVEPPVAATDAIAFSSAAGHDRGRPDVVADEVHRQLAGLARRLVLRGSSAGIPLSPAGDSPEELHDHLIVLAVNWPPQAPAPGHAAFSISYSSSRLILPARYAPTASKTVTTSRSGPCTCPGRSCRCRGRGPGRRAGRAPSPRRGSSCRSRRGRRRRRAGGRGRRARSSRR